MAIYHFHAQIIGRSKGKSTIGASAYVSGSVVAGAAYRACEKLKNSIDGKTHDYTHKTGVVHSEIMLPEHAPEEFMDRGTLWNAVETKNKRKDAQLAREIDVALPCEFSREEQIAITRRYISDNFLSLGACVDFSIHDKGDGNPHAHIMITLDKVSPDGFGTRRVEESAQGYTHAKARLVEWRKNWADLCNRGFEVKGLEERIDHRSFKERGIDRTPTIHLGKRDLQLEKQGIRTEKGNRNREIVKRNLIRSRWKHSQNAIERQRKNALDNARRKKLHGTAKKITDIRNRVDFVKGIEDTKRRLKKNAESLSILDIKTRREITQELERLEGMQALELDNFQRQYGAGIEDANHIVKQYEASMRQANFEIESHKFNDSYLRNYSEELASEYAQQKRSADKYYFFAKGELDSSLRGALYPVESIQERQQVIYSSRYLDSVAKKLETWEVQNTKTKVIDLTIDNT